MKAGQIYRTVPAHMWQQNRHELYSMRCIVSTPPSVNASVEVEIRSDVHREG